MTFIGNYVNFVPEIYIANVDIRRLLPLHPPRLLSFSTYYYNPLLAFFFNFMGPKYLSLYFQID